MEALVEDVSERSSSEHMRPEQVGLELQILRLRKQLALQQLYQVEPDGYFKFMQKTPRSCGHGLLNDGMGTAACRKHPHVIVQRAAQLEIDLDQTAAMLCHEMEEAAERNAVIHQLKGHLAWEKKNGCMAMTAVSFLYAELQQKACNVSSLQHELFITKAKLEHADKLLAKSLSPVLIGSDPGATALTKGRAKYLKYAADSVCQPTLKLLRHNSSPCQKSP